VAKQKTMAGITSSNLRLRWSCKLSVLVFIIILVFVFLICVHWHSRLLRH
jgi:hypothetical protein